MSSGAGTGLRQAAGASAATPSTHGSQTVLQTDAGPSASSNPTLRLRGEQPSQRRGVQWAEDVIDNEGMGKKKSKSCCIYHKPHNPGDSDSSDPSSSSDEGDSDSEPDLSRAQRPAGGNGKRSGRGRGQGGGGSGGGEGKERKPSPNAYERQPKPKAKQAG